MMRISLEMIVAALAAGTFAVGAQAQTAAPSANKGNISMCIGCHGIADYHTAFPEVYHVPRIGGQSPQYIEKALQAYRSGERNHPSMRGIARTLSDQEIANLAAYYGGGGK